jgi:hypothetical protein
MLAAKEAHKRAMKKAKSNWYQFLNDSDSDESDLIDYDFTNRPKALSKTERERLKTTTYTRRNLNIQWFENDD